MLTKNYPLSRKLATFAIQRNDVVPFCEQGIFVAGALAVRIVFEICGGVHCPLGENYPAIVRGTKEHG